MKKFSLFILFAIFLNSCMVVLPIRATKKTKKIAWELEKDTYAFVLSKLKNKSKKQIFEKFGNPSKKINEDDGAEVWFYLYEKTKNSSNQNSRQNKPILKSQGTGFAIHSDGYIATNHHVVEGQKEFLIRGVNGDFTNVIIADLVKEDKENDLAILKVNMRLDSIPYGFNRNKQDVGSKVFAYGYPETDLLGSEVKFTEGIINSNSGFKGDPRWYQHTASIQKGNSGGPLFNKFGNLIGINNAGLMSLDIKNVNYAIKARYLYNLMEDLDLPLLKNSLENSEVTNQYKKIKNFIYLIECSSSATQNNITSNKEVKSFSLDSFDSEIPYNKYLVFQFENDKMKKFKSNYDWKKHYLDSRLPGAGYWAMGMFIDGVIIIASILAGQ